MTPKPRKQDKSRSVGFDRMRIEEDWAESARFSEVTTRERAVLIGVCRPGESESDAREHLDELIMLAETAGADVVDKELVRLRQIDAATFVGSGKAAELALLVAEARADLVVFDDDLAPAQARNLEREFKVRIVDRSGIILDIFARRAKTREARTQVELAQLQYMLPRLSGAWAHLERQRGGIGMRGPGETQIETDRRLIRTRIRKLEEELSNIEKQHTTQRGRRQEVFRFSLAGYTNVGKSTLMNVLTQARVFEENLLFATLDSTTRALPLGGGVKAVLSDTVGFIRKLPHGLVASFRSTLAEISEADCIVHVVDASSPSFREQMKTVEDILTEMGLGAVPTIEVFNKVDAAEDPSALKWVRDHKPEGVLISARKGIGIETLLSKLKDAYDSGRVTVVTLVNPADGKFWNELYRVGEILSSEPDGEMVRLKVTLDRPSAIRLGLINGADPAQWHPGKSEKG